MLREDRPIQALVTMNQADNQCQLASVQRMPIDITAAAIDYTERRDTSLLRSSLASRFSSRLSVSQATQRRVEVTIDEARAPVDSVPAAARVSSVAEAQSAATELYPWVRRAGPARAVHQLHSACIQ